LLAFQATEFYRPLVICLKKYLSKKEKKIKERKTSPLIFSSMQGAKVDKDNPNI
jgi:hypothetical protein